MEPETPPKAEGSSKESIWPGFTSAAYDFHHPALDHQIDPNPNPNLTT